MPKTYTKRPVSIEAVQFTDDASARTIQRWAGPEIAHLHEKDGHVDHLDIATLEGPMTAELGWWIIKGVEGEFYPCKPSVFDSTYDEGQ